MEPEERLNPTEEQVAQAADAPEQPTEPTPPPAPPAPTVDVEAIRREAYEQAYAKATQDTLASQRGNAPAAPAPTPAPEPVAPKVDYELAVTDNEAFARQMEAARAFDRDQSEKRAEARIMGQIDPILRKLEQQSVTATLTAGLANDTQREYVLNVAKGLGIQNLTPEVSQLIRDAAVGADLRKNPPPPAVTPERTTMGPATVSLNAFYQDCVDKGYLSTAEAMDEQRREMAR